MENPFKKISHEEQLPDFLKKKVMDQVAIVKFGLDVSDLFMVKFPSVIKDLLLSNDIKTINETEE